MAQRGWRLERDGRALPKYDVAMVLRIGRGDPILDQ